MASSTVGTIRHQLKTFISVQLETDPVSNIPSHWAQSDVMSFFSMYSLSSFTYATVGLLMLTVYSESYMQEPSIPIPIELHAAGVILQSCVTYIADVHHADSTTHWHLIDRIIATINTVSICIAGLFIDWWEVFIFAVVVPTGLTLLSKSRHTRLTDVCLHAYTRWHSLWHAVYPLAVLAWLHYRQFPDWQHIVHYGVVLMCALVLGIQWFHPRIFHRTPEPLGPEPLKPKVS